MGRERCGVGLDFGVGFGDGFDGGGGVGEPVGLGDAAVGDASGAGEVLAAGALALIVGDAFAG